MAGDSTTWLNEWKPDDERFWRTLIITTIALTLSFATWFMMSAVVVRLPTAGFKFTSMQLVLAGDAPGLSRRHVAHRSRHAEHR